MDNYNLNPTLIPHKHQITNQKSHLSYYFSNWMVISRSNPYYIIIYGKISIH